MPRTHPSSRSASRTKRHAGADQPEQTAPEARIEALLASVGSAVVGERIRRVRTSMGLSIRDVASRGGLSKTSVVRLEQGGTCRVGTLIRVCDVLGLHVDRLRAGGADEDVVAVHRTRDDRWYDMADVAGKPLSPERVGSGAKADGAGVAVAVDLLRSRLARGRVLPTLLEVRRESEARSHPGEEFVYVLSGRLRLTIGAKTVLLNEGESACFLCGEPHAYASAGRGPARILSVRVNST